MYKRFLITIITLFFFRINAQRNIDSTTIYFNQGKYDKSIKYALKYKDDITLVNKGILLYNKNDYKNAIIFLLNAYEFNNEILDESGKISLLNIIAICYKKTNDFENSIITFKKALNLNSINSDAYFNSLGLLTQYMNEIEDFNKAEKMSLFYLSEAKKIKGESNKIYLSALYELCHLYIKADIYNLAEKHCNELIELNNKKYGEFSLESLKANNFLIQLFEREGKLIEAEKLAIEVLNNYYLYHKNENLNIALTHNLLAVIQEGLFKKELAITNYKKGIGIILDNFGKNNSNYVLLIENLASLYIGIQNYQDAELYINEAIQINGSVGISSNEFEFYQLGRLYLLTKRFKDAEKYFLKSIELDKNKLSEFYREKLVSLSITYNYLNESQKEYENLLLVSNNLKEKVIKNTLYMTNNEIEMYIKKNITFSFYNPCSFTFLDNNPLRYEKLNISKFEQELLIKNINLRNFQNIKNSIKRINNTELNYKYSKFIENKKKISKLNEIPEDKKPLFYNDLIKETENLEKYLIENSNKFSEAKKSLSVNWEQIQSTLKPNEVAIELVNYANITPKKNKNDEDDNIFRYSVFVVKKDSKFPKFISLFEEKQLEFLLSRNKNQRDDSRIDKQYIDKFISDLFLKPLEKELEGITTIYLSPSGLGHQIDFSALPINESQTLGEKFKLHILNAPSELIDYKELSLDKKNKPEILLYGGIDYTESNGKKGLNFNDNSISSNEDFINSAKRSDFEKLPGTLTEVNSIYINANKSGFNSKILKKSEATEESIKALDGRTISYALHLATHGFFFPKPIPETPIDNKSFEGKSGIYKASEDPMMRSGLLLAGAKNYWGKSNPKNTIEDGILTASEISNLDLSACQLVVLSACETGLGEVKGSEGVFGLQRAFKMAGVKNIIMSLWKVPDIQTSELFDIFYSECFTGKTIHEAFQSAQYQMKAKYSPYYWAGFVLME